MLLRLYTSFAEHNSLRLVRAWIHARYRLGYDSLLPRRSRMRLGTRFHCFMRSPTSALTRPTKAELRAAAGKRIPDVIAPDLKVLFCGINPGLYSGATGHHFARPGNRFWPALYKAGFTDRLLSPCEGRELKELGYGLTNLVERATARADELSNAELVRGAHDLEMKVRRYRPRFVAVLGVSAYRLAFARPKAIPGRQEEMLDSATLWVLPSPSGLNAHYQLAALTRAYTELYRTVTDRG